MIYPEITCPECRAEVLDTLTEENYVSFECRECNWHRIDDKPFFIDGWHIQVRQALAPIDILQSLLGDEDIVDFLRPRLKGISYITQPIPEFRLGDDYYRGEIEKARSVYLSQMVVVAVTYAELIIESYYYALFSAQPKRMNSFLASDGKGKASIYINQVIDSSSREDLIEKLIKQAANRASKGGLNEIVKKIVKKSELIPFDSFISDLQQLETHRNKIVHEGVFDDTKAEQVASYFGMIIYMLYIVAESAISNGIVVVDDSNLVLDFRERIRERQR